MADSIDAAASVAVAKTTSHLTTPTSPTATDAKGQNEALLGPEHSPAQVKAAIEHHGNRVTFGGRVAEFSYDDGANRVVVKIFSSDEEPREVVRQIPSEEYMAFAARYRDLVGVLFNEQF